MPKFRLSMTIAAFCLCFLAAPLHAEELSLDEVARELRDALPAGWQMQRTHHYWLISRDEPVAFYNGINLPGFDSEEEFRKFVGEGLREDYIIIVRFGTKVTPMQYEDWQADNRRANERQEELARGLRGITPKFDSFAPANAEEEKRVADYHAAVAEIKRHQLPDYFHQRHSIYIETTQNWSLSFLDDEVAKECGRVEALVTRRFTAYETDSE